MRTKDKNGLQKGEDIRERTKDRNGLQKEQAIRESTTVKTVVQFNPHKNG